MRWVVVIVAGLALALLFLGTVVAFSSSLTGGAPSSTPGPDAPAAALTVDPSEIAPTPPADLPSNLPPTVSPPSGPAPNPPVAFPSVDPSKGPPRRVSRRMSKMNARQFRAGMDALSARLARCPDRYIQGFGESVVQDQGWDEPTGLMLEMAMLDGKMEVVDVSLHPNGSASAALVACAQKMLRGQAIAAPLTKAGSRMQIPLSLGPAPPQEQLQLRESTVER